MVSLDGRERQKQQKTLGARFWDEPPKIQTGPFCDSSKSVHARQRIQEGRQCFTCEERGDLKVGGLDRGETERKEKGGLE